MAKILNRIKQEKEQQLDDVDIDVPQLLDSDDSEMGDYYSSEAYTPSEDDSPSEDYREWYGKPCLFFSHCINQFSKVFHLNQLIEYMNIFKNVLSAQKPVR